ncbi:hypothetical protein BS78_06G090500 [Paspalum vaginatum]|nr:hypothetical protein BS78_06G090500 [Paspalum vaginatum]
MGCCCCWQRRNIISRRRVPLLQLLQCWFLLVLLLLLVLLPATGCQASSSRRGGLQLQPFKSRPLEGGAPNNFFGFLPRRLVPPSGPSRQHDSVGLESQRQKAKP